MTIKRDLTQYIANQYGISPDFPWAKYPDTAVFRHTNSRKWFGLVTAIPRTTLGLKSDGIVDILNVKCPPEMVMSLRASPGFFPAYHMNKEHWVTLLLDGTIEQDELLFFLNQSFSLTQG
ncbi:MmcQ/YjbR family DNA-binding protein [Vibrio porteresiae]|uniref:MmcQ/YjbR family DNA-binding protein n=1 Tax=Vibrio porteresiae DSM 19223 TaxID=1123496 RepID=A0ABZ0QA86_9VIBR|nr:MmcQ/YjbR family DNA-binding protein [Vibrio porteresiae]WPC72840.1 MmcQ/YjbR family DNA-binding protein [Vibrio porteresiae DSM 19223]